MPQARFFVGLAAQQDGDKAGGSGHLDRAGRRGAARSALYRHRAPAHRGSRRHGPAARPRRLAVAPGPRHGGPAGGRRRGRGTAGRPAAERDPRHGRRTRGASRRQRPGCRGLAEARARLSGARGQRQGHARRSPTPATPWRTTRARSRVSTASPTNSGWRARPCVARRRRLVLISGALGVAGVAAGLTLFALRDSVVFFYGPTRVRREGARARHAAADRRPRREGLARPCRRRHRRPSR